MRCITVDKLKGDMDKVVRFSTTRPKPTLRPGDGRMIIRTLAVSIAPGDVRVLRGQCDFMQSPKSFPYIPGGDSCGEVVEVHPGEKEFKVGDRVMVLFEDAPRNALAEFNAVKTSLAAHIPEILTPIEASALPSSAMTAMIVAERHIAKGSRVLILNGSGGVGSHLVQAAKTISGASYVAATSTQNEMLSKLGVDRVIDYRSENWWEVQELHDGGGLDVIIDLWGGVEAWNQAKVKRSPLKDTGLFVSTIGDNPYPEVHNVFEVLKMLFHIMCRKLSNWLTPEQPKYVLGQGVHADPAILQRLAQRVKEGAITPVVDASSPFDFSAEGVKQALKLQESRHAHGKVVVLVATP